MIDEFLDFLIEAISVVASGAFLVAIVICLIFSRGDKK